MKELGKDVAYVEYPDEGHGFEKPANIEDSIKRQIALIKTQFKK